MNGIIILKAQAGVARAHEVEKLVAVFAYEWLDVVAGYIVPFDAIVIKVVQDCQARFVVALKVKLCTIVVKNI